MRNAAASVCFLSLFLGFGDPGTLRPKAVRAFASGGSSLSPPPQVGFPLPPRVISVGEVVTGTLTATGLTEIVYELTAPSDGLLFVSLDHGPSMESVGLLGQGFFFTHFLTFGPPAVTAVRVFAGQTYRFWVVGFSGYYYEPFVGPVTFVLTTSLVGCTFAPPALSWVCVNGGWVPAGHPLAAPPPPPPAVAPEPPPVVDAVGCPSIKPAATWICLNGGWVPPDHPLALSASPNPAPPSPPPVPTGVCTTPDPFLGIPGLFGVCVNGGWVPIGHPLAGGGG
jgi:hypothetical protein